MPLGTVSPDMLHEIVWRMWRIGEVADPAKIVLFSSAARGEMRLNSDLGLLIVTAGNPHRGRLTEENHMGLRGVGTAVDVIVVTPEDVERYRDTHAIVIKPAIRDGRVIYEGVAVVSRCRRRVAEQSAEHLWPA